MILPMIRGGRIFSWFSGLCLLLLTAGCGGGGGGGGNLSSSGSTVQVFMVSAPGFPAGTTFTASPAAVEVAAKPVSPGFDNVFVEIYKVALLPSREGEGPDPEGEVVAADDGPGHDGMFVSAIVDPPVVVNLKNLPPGQSIARFLNRFLDVPAGTYGKVRVYYKSLWGEREVYDMHERIDFHPTANSRFDVHFVGGDLVIPAGSDPDGDIRLFDVTINFVGLKITENKNKVLMRPQVFATVEDVQYVISGIADNVDRTLGAFDVSTAGGPFHVEYDVDTFWSFRDGSRSIDVESGQGISALDNTAIVDVFGLFSSSGNLMADNVHIMFPLTVTDNVISGDAASGWNSDNTIILDISSDNVVYPMPDREHAIYDNAVSPFNRLNDSFVVKGARVIARGYPADAPAGGVEAFWISIGP